MIVSASSIIPRMEPWGKAWRGPSAASANYFDHWEPLQILQQHPHESRGSHHQSTWRKQLNAQWGGSGGLIPNTKQQRGAIMALSLERFHSDSVKWRFIESMRKKFIANKQHNYSLENNPIRCGHSISVIKATWKLSLDEEQGSVIRSVGCNQQPGK